MLAVLAIYRWDHAKNPLRIVSEECQCCDMWHLHGPDICTRIVSSGSWDERRGGSGESYSAGLTALPRRESCQFRSDPRVRVPETAGLAFVSTHPSGLSARLDYSRSLGGISSDKFSRFCFHENAWRAQACFISVPKRHSVIICLFARWHAFLILDIFVLSRWWRVASPCTKADGI